MPTARPRWVAGPCGHCRTPFVAPPIPAGGPLPLYCSPSCAKKAQHARWRARRMQGADPGTQVVSCRGCDAPVCGPLPICRPCEDCARRSCLAKKVHTSKRAARETAPDAYACPLCNGWHATYPAKDAIARRHRSATNERMTRLAGMYPVLLARYTPDAHERTTARYRNRREKA